MAEQQAPRSGGWWVVAVTVLGMAAGIGWWIRSGAFDGDSAARLDTRSAAEIQTPELGQLPRGQEVLAGDEETSLPEAEAGVGSTEAEFAAGDRVLHEVSGIVVRASDGAPVADAKVLLLRRPPALSLAELVRWDQYRPGEDAFPGESQVRGEGLESFNPPPPREAPTTRTDLEGRFRFGVAHEWPVYLAAEAAGLYQRDFFPVDTTAAEASRVQLRLHPAASVEGTVTDRDRRLVAGARVVFGDEFDPMAFAAGAALPMRSFETQTDSRGRFVLAAVSPGGRKYLKVSAEGYAKHVESRLQCGAGQTLARDIVLSRGGTIRGRVVAAGEPVAEAKVVAMVDGVSAFDIPGRIEGMRDTQTGADGGYELEQLVEGRYRVRVDGPGWLPSEATVVEVENEKAVRADFALEAGLEIAGIVLDDSGQPIEGARVVPVRQRSLLDLTDVERDGRLRSVGRAETDDAGRFECLGLVEGQYDLEVTAEGHAEHERSDVEAGTDGLVIRLPRPGAIEGAVITGDSFEPVDDFTVEIPRAIDVPMASMEIPGRIERFRKAKGRFRLEGVKPGQVSLRVRAEGYIPARVDDVVVIAGETAPGLRVVLVPGARLAGRVLATTGDPVSGARLTTKTGMEKIMAAFDAQQSATTDDKGRFSLSGLEPGTITLSVSHPDFAGTSLRRRLSKGQTVDDLEIVLASGSIIEGRVFDREGQAAKSVMVFATVPGRMDFKQATTGDDGSFVLAGLAAGQYEITALLGSLESSEDVLAAISGQVTRRVTVGEEAHEYVELRGSPLEGVRLSGVVTQAGEPLDGGLLMVTSADSQQPTASAMIGEGGRYEVEGLPSGDYQVVIQGGPGLGDFVPFDLTVVEEEGAIERDFDLPGSELTGQVISAESREPLSGVRVLLRETGSDDVVRPGLKQALTDSEGKFRFRSLKPGRYRLVVGGTGFIGRDDAGHEILDDVDVSGSKSDVGVVRLSSGGGLSGRVIDAAGRPISGVLVGLDDDRGRAVLLPGEVPLDEGGQFTIEGLSPGTYTIRLRLPSGEEQRRGAVRVISGVEPTEVTITVAR